MLSKTADYALRSVVCLTGGTQNPALSLGNLDAMPDSPLNNGEPLPISAKTVGCGSGGLMSADSIALMTKVPRRYLHRVLQDLVAAKILASRPGPGGGYFISCDLTTLSVLDVVNAVSPFERIRSCPLGISTRSLCPLHSALDRTYEAAERALATLKISELVGHAEIHGATLCKSETA